MVAERRRSYCDEKFKKISWSYATKRISGLRECRETIENHLLLNVYSYSIN